MRGNVRAASCFLLLTCRAQYESYMQTVVGAYGVESLFLWHNLESAGMLWKQVCCVRDCRHFVALT